MRARFRSRSANAMSIWATAIFVGMGGTFFWIAILCSTRRTNGYNARKVRVTAGICKLSVKTLIRNATVVLPGGSQQTGVIFEGSKIAAIDPAAHTKVDEAISARGLHLIPGVIDDQV